MHIPFRFLRSAAACALGFAALTSAHATDIVITLTNTAPAGGVGMAPLWLGLQASGAGVVTLGTGASAGVERAAEEGDASLLSAEFAAGHPEGAQTTLPGGPVFPGGTRTITLTGLDLTGANRYLNYLAMVVLSNDYFTGSLAPIDLSSLANGGTLSLNLGGLGRVFDAGTEVNDYNYSVANAAFGIGGGQSAMGQGVAENGVIHTVTGNPYSNFLGQDLVPANYDFSALNFNAQDSFGTLTISVVPEPSQLALLFGGLGAVGVMVRRRRT